MKELDIILYPIGQRDGNVIRGEAWTPEKKFVRAVGDFTLFRSDPTESTSGTVQFALRRLSCEDIMRVDSYKEGYFSAYWDSDISFANFLLSVESYLSNYNTEIPTNDVAGTVGIFRPWKEPFMAAFTRPLVVDDFKENGESLLDTQEHPGFIRIETEVGDLLYKGERKTVGIIAYLDEEQQEKIIKTITDFIKNTQPEIPESAIGMILRTLPYKKTSDEESEPVS